MAITGRLYGFQNTLFKNPKFTGMSENEIMGLWEKVDALAKKSKITESPDEIDEIDKQLIEHMESYKVLLEEKTENVQLLLDKFKSVKLFNTDLYAVKDKYTEAKELEVDEDEEDLRELVELLE